MLRLLGIGAVALGAWRGYQAQRAGVPLMEAFEPRNLFTPIARLVAVPATVPAPARDPDDVMVPEWLDD